MRIDIGHERMKLLWDMLQSAKNPHDPDRGIWQCDYPFAKIGIERLRVRFPDCSGHWTRLEELRRLSRLPKSDGTIPPFGGAFHAAMLAGFEYAEMILNEWIEMQSAEIERHPIISEGPTDGTCTVHDTDLS